MEYEGIEITWLGHDCFLFDYDGKKIYVDPFKLDEGAKIADLVCITHEHFDHCSIEDLRRVVGPETVIVCPQECLGKVNKVHPEGVYAISAGESHTLKGIEITAVPAYNTNKFRDGETVFHPQEDGKLGYVIAFGETHVYHAGDTDEIPEMRDVQCDVALLPVSGTYVMTAEEAAEAARTLAPKLAIPMHYGSIVGTSHDAERFKRLLDGEVRVELLQHP